VDRWDQRICVGGRGERGESRGGNDLREADAGELRVAPVGLDGARPGGELRLGFVVVVSDRCASGELEVLFVLQPKRDRRGDSRGRALESEARALGIGVRERMRAEHGDQRASAQHQNRGCDPAAIAVVAKAPLCHEQPRKAAPESRLPLRFDPRRQRIPVGFSVFAQRAVFGHGESPL